MIKKLLTVIGLFIILAAATGYYVVNQAKLSILKPILITKPTLFTVNHGANFHHVMQQLTKEHMVKESLYVRFLPRLYPQLMNVRAGTYQFKPKQTLQQLLQQLNRGDEHQFSITFIEGSRFSDWLVQLKQAPYLKHDLSNLTENKIAEALSINRPKLEGLFLAETYNYTAGTSEHQILMRAHKKLMTILDDNWQQHNNNTPLKSAYQALTLASIIEKETALDNERPMVAAVFTNRLKKRMRLQTDPTVIYGMGDKYKGNIRKHDLRTPTPYNTYVINGLPPTPIAMVGKSAIEAAVNPVQSSFLYFVANGKGGHTFSTTLAAHNRAVHAYLIELRKK